MSGRTAGISARRGRFRSRGQKFFETVHPLRKLRHLFAQALQLFGLIETAHAGPDGKRLQYAKVERETKQAEGDAMKFHTEYLT